MRLNPFTVSKKFIPIAKSVAAFNVLLNEQDTDPHLLQDIIKLQKAISETPYGKVGVDYQLKDKDMKLNIQENWQPERINLDKLSLLKPGTLGRVLADNLIQEGFSPEELLDLDPYPIDSPYEYCTHRGWQIHDITHALTGFDVNACGEIGLQAYHFAQTHDKVHLFLFFSVLFRMGGKSGELDFDDQYDMKQFIDSISRGLHLGINSKMINATRIEESFDKPIAELRLELGLPLNDDTSLPFIREGAYKFSSF